MFGGCSTGILAKRSSCVCDMLASVEGIRVVAIPVNLKTANSVLFVRERGGYIHLNSDGVGALSRVYRNCFLGDRREDGARAKGTSVASSIGVDGGQWRFEYVVDKNTGDHGRVENMASSGSVMGRGGDKGEADKDVGSRFGLLVNTLIEGLSRFT